MRHSVDTVLSISPILNVQKEKFEVQSPETYSHLRVGDLHAISVENLVMNYIFLLHGDV